DDYSTFEVADLGVANQHPPPPCAASGPGCTITSSPLLSWDPVPHANYYKVILAFDAEFTNQYREYEVDYPIFKPREELRDSDAGEVYFWHVRPCVTESRCGPDPQGVTAPSATFQKRSSPVVLESPADGAVVPDEPRFEW